MAIPVMALIVAGSTAGGGVDAVLITLEGTIREAFTALVNFVRSF